MSGVSLIPLAGAVLEDRDLGTLLLSHNSRQYFSPCDGRSTDLDSVIIDNQQHFVQLNLLTGISGQFFDANGITNASPILTRA